MWNILFGAFFFFKNCGGKYFYTWEFFVKKKKRLLSSGSFLFFFFRKCGAKYFYTYTPYYLVRGSRWLCTQNLYANFGPWLTRHPNVNKWINSQDLLIFSKFHGHILKNQTMLFRTFISASEKTGVGLKKQAANFYFNFTQRRVVQYSCFDFFTSAKWRYFQLSWLWNTYLSNKMYCNPRPLWTTQDAKFPKHLFWGLKNLYQIWLTRPTTLVGRGEWEGEGWGRSIMKLLYDFAQLRASNICKHSTSKPCWHTLLQNLSVFTCL